MQNPSPLQGWQIQYNRRQHHQRLKEIKNDKFSSSVAWPRDSLRKLRPSKRNTFAEREIAKENEVIIKKLQEQSTRKSELNHQLPGPKSLNASHRNQESRRIAKENERFIKRIHQKPSVINMRHLETDFKRTREYARIRSKSHLAKVNTKLPALKPRTTVEESIPEEPESLQYSTNFKLMSVTPLPDFGMDGPMEIIETIEEHCIETE